MVLDSFVKYQSLGNDFVVFDWFKKPRFYLHEVLKSDKWPAFVKRVCDRHRGVGADCVLLIVSSEQTREPEIIIYNADGSKAQSCGNGVRCVAHYLHTQRSFPAQFSIIMDNRLVACSVNKYDGAGNTYVVTDIGLVDYEKELTISCAGQKFLGHSLSAGNPHFVILQETNLAWLAQHGHLLESHQSFSEKTNVEFVWQTGDFTYDMLVYERGCGITQACSSGASAVIKLLFYLKKIMYDQRVTVAMPGGNVVCWLDKNEHVFLQASAQFVFSGVLQNNESIIFS